MIVKLAEGPLKTRFGEWTEILFYDGQRETIALILGDVSHQEKVLCRLHSSCIFGHYFNSIECDCREQMEDAQQRILKEGRGIIILLDQEGKGNGHFALLSSVAHKRKGQKQADAYRAAGFPEDSRDFRPAGKILIALNVTSVRLITENNDKAEALRENGIVVTELITCEDLSNNN
jgi:GTP cyclohydrolase II